MRWSLVVVVAIACGHPDRVTPTPTPVPVPVPVLDRPSVVCDRAVRCGIIGASQRAECEAPHSRLTLVWGSPDLLGFDALIAKHHVHPDPGGEQRCLAELARASCRDPATDTICGIGFRPLVPDVAPGGACTRWDECIDGFCSSQAACTGTCIARHPIGASCGANELCTDGTFCLDGTCRRRGVIGDACSDWQSCSDALFCDGFRPANESTHDRSPEVPGVCKPPRGIGESCAGAIDSHCRADLYCTWGDPAPTCQPTLARGAECRWLDACGDGLACRGLTLHGVTSDHHYAVARAGMCGPMLDAGEPCDPTAFVSGCPSAMRCDGATKQCRSTGHAGDRCESSWITKPHPDGEPLDNAGCVSANYCDVATRTCKKHLAIGEACTPQTFGVEDEPCFLGKCDAATHHCVTTCK